MQTRERIKEVVRRYAAGEGPGWEEVAQGVGLTASQLAWWRRRADWTKLLAEVAEERLREGLPVATERLVSAARSDKTAAGITAAKTLLDLLRPRPAEALEAGGDLDFENLSKEERELLCRVFGRRQG